MNRCSTPPPDSTLLGQIYLQPFCKMAETRGKLARQITANGPVDSLGRQNQLACLNLGSAGAELASGQKNARELRGKNENQARRPAVLASDLISGLQAAEEGTEGGGTAGEGRVKSVS